MVNSAAGGGCGCCGASVGLVAMLMRVPLYRQLLLSVAGSTSVGVHCSAKCNYCCCLLGAGRGAGPGSGYDGGNGEREGNSRIS